MDPEVERYVAELIATAGDVLGDDLVGAYAAGSVALGAYQPGRSDVDVALLCARALADGRKRELVARLRHEVLPCPARGLELVVYHHEVARSGTPEPGFEVELNTGAGMPSRVTWSGDERPASDGRFWYGLDRSILHSCGLTLAGPPAGEAFADMTPADLRRLLVDALTWWLALPTPPGDEPAAGTEDAVLGACRALVRCRDGIWLPKVAAGRRVIGWGHPASGLIERAIAARHGGPPPGGRTARAFQQGARDGIRAML
ncbi:nucleotidyltransferase [Micromonospora sp. ATCC 39149]|uniref:Nucleotidyltransferase domain-containing protein n=1 Tax=Micromonospora carbonacea TaxID=47853 RepID=A0A7D6CFK2_9ACTN|nr:nucleotidyltransferase [Micromonospora sp. ATCC 39149]QLJ97351.1 nucleotidyltransferase domain-containing protein [Micromonospora carbonacea]